VHLGGNNSGLGGSSLSSGLVLAVVFPVLSIDGNLDSELATVDFLSLEGRKRLLLFLLRANVNEAVTLALPGGAPPLPDDASGGDNDAIGGKDFSELSIVDIEAEVSNKEDGLGGFANRSFTGGAGGAFACGTGGLFLSSSFAVGCRDGGGVGRSSSLATSDSGDGILDGLLGLFPLEICSDRRIEELQVTYQVPLLLGFSGDGSIAFWLVLAFCLRFGDLTRRRFATPPPSPPLSPPLSPLLVFLILGLGDFDDDCAAVELLLVQSFSGLFGSLESTKGHKTVASRAGSALNDLSGETVAR